MASTASRSEPTSRPNPNVIPPQAQFDPTWSIGARLSWSPNRFQRGQVRSDGVTADLARTRSEADLVRRRFRVEIRTQSAALEGAREAFRAAEVRVRAADEAFEARKRRFSTGQATLTEVLEADSELRSAQLSKVTALTDAHLADARLRRAEGTLRDIGSPSR
ncbi:MAG: TolC family protein [Myxococcota bacterium]